MKRPELVGQGTIADATSSGIEVMLPEFTAVVIRKLLAIVGDNPRGRGFVEACSARVLLQANYLAAKSSGHPGWTSHSFITGKTTTISVPRNAPKSLRDLRSALGKIDRLLTELAALELLQTPAIANLAGPIDQRGVRDMLARLDRWAAEWQPLITVGRGRKPGSAAPAGMLASSIRSLWARQFAGTQLEGEVKRCNDAIAIVLKASGLEVERDSISDIGRRSPSGAKPIRKK